MIGVNPAVPVAAEQLPSLAMARPAEARRHAEDLLARGSSMAERIYAWHALGIVERDGGRVGEAIRHFRRGLSATKRLGLEERHADLAASLATALALAGRYRDALLVLDNATARSRGALRARILVRRAGVRIACDDLDGAYRDGLAAAQLLERIGDTTWVARALNNAGLALLGLGRFADAAQRFARAEMLAERQGQHFDATAILHNLGDCAHRQGDLPRALRVLYQARDRYRELGVVPPEVVRDIAVVLLAAGLTAEAAATADELVSILDSDRASAGRRADGLIVAAKAHLDNRDPERAAALARRAIRANHRQGNVEGERHARLVLLQAQATNGRVTKWHARAAAALASELKDRYAAERLEAQLLAGLLARRTGLPDLAVRHFGAAAVHRHKGSALRRAEGWLAAAQLADMQGDRARLLRACERGLDVLDTHALSLGATELRATATAHGVELIRTAIRRILDDGSARDLLRWTERWRSTLHATPSRQARRDPALTAELAKLREIEHDVGNAVDTRREAQRRTIEERIRRLTHGSQGDGSGRRHGFDVGALLDELGDDTTLAGVLAARGRLYVAVARSGRVRRFDAGSVQQVRTEVEYARFALRGAAVSSGPAAEALLVHLEPALARLEAALLGPALRAIGDGPLVLMPPATLHSAPWGALPSLRDRPVAVTPSATAWLRARATVAPRRRRVALVAGPDLATSGAEVKALAPLYRDATVLAGDAATTESTLAAIDGAWLAHVGAHGRFRGDNPMFSALEMADGPLTIYDLETIRRPPYRMVLTACESGVGSPTGADELLGLASSLTALGTAGLLASIVSVNDAASVSFSLTIHERLRARDDLATALLAARQAADDPVSTATAWSFLALGAS